MKKTRRVMPAECSSTAYAKFQNALDMSYNKDKGNSITPIGIAAKGSTLFEGVVLRC
jgi:hypothetical protein